MFGTNSTFETIRAKLKPEFSRRGWQVHDGYARWFSAHAPANDVCISYSAFTREEASNNVQRYGGSLNKLWSRYSATLDVYIDDCYTG